MASDQNRDKGKDLERRVARIEFARGSTVTMRFPVRVYDHQGPETITDIDVLSVHFDQKLRPYMTIMECKAVRGRSGEADRLLVLAGLREFVKADKAVLVRLSASNRGREIARQLGIDLWDSEQLEQLEKTHLWVPERFGPVAGYKYEELYLDATATLKSVKDFPRDLFARLCYDAWIDPPYKILQSLMTLSEHSATGSGLPRSTYGVVMANALLALTMAALRTASQLDALGHQRVRNMIESGIITGTPYTSNANKLLNIARHIDDLLRDQIELVHNVYTQAGASKQRIDVVSIQKILAEATPWIDKFMDLAFRCRARPDLSRDLPQVVQLSCFDALTRDINWQAPAFDHLFTPEHRQLLIIALNTLEEIIGTDIDVLYNLKLIPFERNVELLRDRDQTYDSAEEQYQEAMFDSYEGGTATPS